MTISTRQSATLSLTTQIATKGINLGLSVLFVRFAPNDCIGFFTLLIAAAQLVCSLGRIGTNYSFAVLLPKQADSASQRELTLNYSMFSIASSLVVAGGIIWQMTLANGLPTAWKLQPWLFSGITIVYLLSDSISETIWSIHLALGRFRIVFLRDVWLAIGKGILPLVGAMWLGVAGVVTGLGILSILNCSIATCLLQSHKPIGANSPTRRKLSWKILYQLLAKGLPFFSVPLVHNMILWPLLIRVVNEAGIDRLDTLRVAQICSQAIGIISGSLMPILLVKASHDEQSGHRLNQWAFQTCWMISMLIYGAYVLSDTTIIPLIFGHGVGDEAIQTSRILVVATAIQGLSQIPLQRPFTNRKLTQLSFLQIFSLVAAGLLAVKIISPSGTLTAYASVNLISPLITVLCLPAVLCQRLVPDSKTPWLEISVSLLLISTCFRMQAEPWQFFILALALAVLIIKNLDLLSQLHIRT